MTTSFILSASIADQRLNNPAWALDKMQRLESAGLDLLQFGRVGMIPFDAVVIASWAAPLTDKMGIVPVVTTGRGHPFHAARALSAIDHLSGASCGWSVVSSGDDPAEMAADFARAAQAMWDGWADDTLIMDKATGHYLDGSTVKVPKYAGAHYKVRGPLNAARPAQGHPVLVTDDQSQLPGIRADIALIADAAQPSPAQKQLLKIDAAFDLDNIRSSFEAGQIGGVHLELASMDELLGNVQTLSAAFKSFREGRLDGATLRDRLGVPLDQKEIGIGEAA